MRRILAGLVASVAVCLTTLSLAAQQPATAGRAATPAIKETARATVVPRSSPSFLPGTRPVISTIQGNALSSTNGALPSTLVRLRDARLGRIVDTEVTDRSGLFTFRTVDPGNYIVEIMGNESTVLATSQVLTVNAGEVISTVVKLPFRIPPFAGFLGQTTQSAASTAVVTTAASTGVLTTGPLSVCTTGPCQ